MCVGGWLRTCPSCPFLFHGSLLYRHDNDPGVVCVWFGSAGAYSSRPCPAPIWSRCVRHGPGQSSTRSRSRRTSSNVLCVSLLTLLISSLPRKVFVEKETTPRIVIRSCRSRAARHVTGLDWGCGIKARNNEEISLDQEVRFIIRNSPLCSPSLFIFLSSFFLTAKETNIDAGQMWPADAIRRGPFLFVLAINLPVKFVLFYFKYFFSFWAD